MDTEQPLDTLLTRLREALGELAPEPLLQRMKPVVESFLSQFQLVPKHEYDVHMKAIDRLEQTVAALEKRIDSLEQADS